MVFIKFWDAQTHPLTHSLTARLETPAPFLACNAFIRTNRHAVALMFVRLGQACIVIIRYTLARI